MALNPCGEHTEQKYSEWKDTVNLMLCFPNKSLSFCLMLFDGVFSLSRIKPKAMTYESCFVFHLQTNLTHQ